MSVFSWLKPMQISAVQHWTSGAERSLSAGLARPLQCTAAKRKSQQMMPWWSLEANGKARTEPQIPGCFLFITDLFWEIHAHEYINLDISNALD